MRFDELFEKRKLTGTKLKDYIRSNGFSKVSFCKKTEISRPTLDKILNGEMYTDMFLTEYIILAIHLNSQGALPDMVLNKVKENANLMV